MWLWGFGDVWEWCCKACCKHWDGDVRHISQHRQQIHEQVQNYNVQPERPKKQGLFRNSFFVDWILNNTVL